LVYLVGLVCLVCLVSLVHLVSSIQPNKPNEPDRPSNDLLVLAAFINSLLSVLGETDKIQVVVVIGENGFCLISEAHEQVDVPGSP
jgi:hypothetical protein